MKKRLMYALVGVTLFALILSSVGGYILSRRQANQMARRQATASATSLIQQFDNRGTALALNACHRKNSVSVCQNRLLNKIKIIEHANNAKLILINSQGTITSGTLPNGVSISSLQINALLSGQAQSGLLNNNTAFAAIPIPDTSLSVRLFHGDTPVVVLTRSIPPIFPNAGYFLLAALISLIIAGIIAVYLSTRISKPLTTVAKTADQISKGDLSARVPIEPKDYIELRELSGAINQMAASLEFGKQMEREFFMEISHDLNTPLTSILGYAEAISDDISDDVKRDAGIIKNQAIRLQRLVQDILNLAKLESTQFAVNLSAENVNLKLNEICDSFKQSKTVTGRNLNLKVNLCQDDAVALLDPDRFRQIISNIIDNATKYAATTIGIQTTLVDGDRSLNVEITDDGPGISAEDSPHIFDKYYRSKGQPEGVSGSGLGLTIAKELANKMRCSLEVISPISTSKSGDRGGLGTKFTIKIPLIKN